LSWFFSLYKNLASILIRFPSLFYMLMETLSDMRPMYIEQILYIVYAPFHLGQALIESTACALFLTFNPAPLVQTLVKRDDRIQERGESAVWVRSEPRLPSLVLVLGRNIPSKHSASAGLLHANGVAYLPAETHLSHQNSGFSLAHYKADYITSRCNLRTWLLLRIPSNTVKAMGRFDQAAGREKRDKKLQPIIGIALPRARKSCCVLLMLKFVDFARDVHSKLNRPRTSISGINLQSEINHQISIVTEFSQKSSRGISPRTAKELERSGKDLWNLCIRLRRRNAQSDWSSPLLLRARVFAFHLLEMGRGANRRRRDRESEIVYMADLVLTLGRLCLDDEDLDSARIIMQKATNYIERLHSRAQEDGSNKSRIALEADYLVVRIALVRLYLTSPQFPSLTNRTFQVVERKPP
jgi:hypothetical protein